MLACIPSGMVCKIVILKHETLIKNIVNLLFVNQSLPITTYQILALFRYFNVKSFLLFFELPYLTFTFIKIFFQITYYLKGTVGLKVPLNLNQPTNLAPEYFQYINKTTIFLAHLVLLTP